MATTKDILDTLWFGFIYAIPVINHYGNLLVFENQMQQVLTKEKPEPKIHGKIPIALFIANTFNLMLNSYINKMEKSANFDRISLVTAKDFYVYSKIYTFMIMLTYISIFLHYLGDTVYSFIKFTFNFFFGCLMLPIVIAVNVLLVVLSLPLYIFR